MTRVGIIEAGCPSQKTLLRYGDYPQMFCTYFAGQPDMIFSTFSVLGQAPLPKAKACDAWIITGSDASVYENHAWIPPLMDFVRETTVHSVPTLGICFGHQLMAQALGGNIVKSDRERGIGVHQYMLTDAGKEIIGGMTNLNLMAAHKDQVVTPPPNAIRLAQSAFCPYAAFSYGHAGMSFQAHPEFTPDFERDLIKVWQDETPAPEAVVETAMRTLDDIKLDSNKLAPILGRFLTHQRAP